MQSRDSQSRVVTEGDAQKSWIDSVSAMEASRFTSRIWGSNRWDSILNQRDFRVRIHAARGRRLGFSLCEMVRGCRLTMLEPHSSAYVLYLGIEGSIELSHQQGVDRIPSGRIALRLAHEGLSIAARDTVRAVVGIIPSDLLHRRLQESRDRSYALPVQFHQDRSDRPANSLAAKLLADCLVTQVARDLRRMPQPDWGQTESILLALLLETLPHQPPCARPVNQTGTPWYVALAEKHIEDRITEPISMQRLAEVTGMSERTLHEGFRKHHGHSPMKFLRERRMQRVRTELSEPAVTTSVTDAALKWGFCHLGRFSSYYAEKFGEKPSETLLKARVRERGAHPAMRTAHAGGH